MSIKINKNGKEYDLGFMPEHYPGDRVYLDGDTTKTVQDKCARKADLTNLDLTGTTNTTGSTIASGTYFYLNGVLVRAKTDIASGATFTLNTNYEVVTVGGALENINGEIANFTSGYYLGIYVSINDNSFGILVPFDVQHKGVPTPTILDVNYVGAYTNNPTVTLSRDNAIVVKSDDLIQNANFVGRYCSVYLR